MASKTCPACGSGDLAGALIQVTSAVVRSVSEVADKRAWFTMPEEIWLAKLSLQPRGLRDYGSVSA